MPATYTIDRISELYAEVRHGFFHTAIGDIYRAMSSHCFAGTFTLACCTISALAELDWSVDNQDKLFRKLSRAERNARPSDRDMFTNWLKKWVIETGINPACDPEIVYAIRCSLVHTYGTVDRLRDAEIGPFSLYKGNSASHYQRAIRPSGKYSFDVNMEDFVAEMTLAAVTFIDKLPQRWRSRCDESIERYVKSLLLPIVPDDNGNPARQIGMFGFGQIHPALGELNFVRPSMDKQIIVNAVRQMWDDLRRTTATEQET